VKQEGRSDGSGATGKPRYAIRMMGIAKSFPGVRALASVDLAVRPGEIHAVVGENGAGKSTLVKILAGVHTPDEGRIEIDDAEVTISSPLIAQRFGIRMVYQELNLVPDLTVAENITLGRMPQRRGLFDRARAVDDSERVLGDLNAKLDPNELVGNLTVGQQQLVEIAKAYLADPRIIVFDEPTSSLSEHEAAALFAVIRTMRARGIAIIYISHRLREVLDLADTLTVIRDGRAIETRAVEGMTPQDMIAAMVGRELADLFPKRGAPIGQIALSVEGLGRRGVFSGVSFHVRRGEIVGFAGLVGAGRTEVARVLFGLDHSDAGTIDLGDRRLVRLTPIQARRAGIVYVPEDRKLHGLVPSMSVRSNLTLAIIGSLSRWGWIGARRERQTATSLIRRLGVSPPLPDRNVSTLSGGNQQKVVIGKWLATNPKVLLLDEPTRGVDVGAKAEIHQLIGDLVEQGIAVVLISSELAEILAVSDRTYVFHEGRITAELSRQDATEQTIMTAATGEVAT